MSKEWKSYSDYLNKLFKSPLFIIGMIGVFVTSAIILFLFATDNMEIFLKNNKLFLLVGIFSIFVFIAMVPHRLRYMWGKT